ncbi:MAG: NAD(P)/FAD-dependent oxidoreductase [Acidobacteriota bacterium]|nr:NAD(P)/FAD-dependent oxidoreductase [Acidobacteriota bacterium]
MTNSNGYDVIVIGGGPAGSTAATTLAQNNRSVLLLEKEKFPRYHIGESLIPFCYFPLKRIGMIPKMERSGFVQKLSVQFVSTSGTSSQPFYFSDHYDHPASSTWQVDRATFDQMMLEHARENGVHAIEEIKVKNIIEEDGAVKGVIALDKEGKEYTWRAPVTIDCTGRDGLLMNRKRWRVPEKGLNKTAVWTYFKGAKRDPGRDEGATTVAYLPQKGWFWYIPLANDMVSVGAVANKDYLFSETTDLETILWREIKKNKWVHERVSQGEQVGEYHATSDFSYRAKHVAVNGMVLAGDAFSFLDPVFSSGVFLALTSGVMVADAVEECLKAGDVSAERFDDYAVQYRDAIEAMRKFVYAFYDLEFNIGHFLKDNPHVAGDLTDCLIGNVFGDLDELFARFADYVNVPDELPHGRPLISEAVA